MSLRHLLRATAVLSALAAPGAALAQCTKDTDCKGDRVCNQGVCVFPGERAGATQQAPPPAEPPPAPPPPPAQPAARPPPPRPAFPAAPARSQAAWEASARKNVFSVNLLSTVGGWLTAASQGLQAQYPGLTISQFTLVYERALSPYTAIVGTLSPNYWSSPGAGSTLYCGATLGWKYYFFGDAPNGFWAGGEVGNLPLDAGPGVVAEAGYQWVLDFGLQLSAIGGLALGAVFGLQLSYGVTIGWVF